VLPALIRKAHEARLKHLPEMVVWGSGEPRREFLHVDDLAEAAVFLMLRYDSADIINVGVGEDISIRELAELVCRVVGYRGQLVFDASKPDGTPRKLLDVTRMSSLGWTRRTPLREGLALFYKAFLKEHSGHA